MDSESSWDAHRCAMDHLLRLFDAHVELAACDLQPDYSTTRIAEEWSRSNGVPLVRVQHHHAHLASCLAENGEVGAAIGLCLDGTGYGTDGTLWGGELLVGDMVNFERAGHLLAVPMPGGESAVRFPWRMALAWLRRVFGEHIFDLPLPLLSQLRKEPGDKAVELLVNPHLPGNHAPLTSGLGRLFDAVAAILFFGTRSQYEGQAAAQLEWMMSNRHENPYPVEIEETGDGLALSPIPLFRQLCDDIAHEVQPAIISRRFHEGIVHGFARMCTMTRERYGVNRVALTGGCFQNEFLLSGLVDRLTADGFRVLTHHRVPTNDGGVSLGQAVAANSRRN